MTCSTEEYQAYTILFQKLAEARSAQDATQRKETDRIMVEADQIKAVRELAEAASQQTGILTYTRA